MHRLDRSRRSNRSSRQTRKDSRAEDRRWNGTKKRCPVGMLGQRRKSPSKEHRRDDALSTIAVVASRNRASSEAGGRSVGRSGSLTRTVADPSVDYSGDLTWTWKQVLGIRFSILHTTLINAARLLHRIRAASQAADRSGYAARVASLFPFGAAFVCSTRPLHLALQSGLRTGYNRWKQCVAAGQAYLRAQVLSNRSTIANWSTRVANWRNTKFRFHIRRHFLVDMGN